MLLITLMLHNWRAGVIVQFQQRQIKMFRLKLLPFLRNCFGRQFDHFTLYSFNYQHCYKNSFLSFSTHKVGSPLLAQQCLHLSGITYVSAHRESGKADRSETFALQPVHDDHTFQDQSHPHNKQVGHILHLRAAASHNGTSH